MKFYLVYENENNWSYLKGAYLTEAQAKENCKGRGKSYHTERIDGKLKMVETISNFTIEETEVENPVFDIWLDYISDGRRISKLTYSEACELFDKYSEFSWVELQIPLKQFDSFGVSMVKTNKNDRYYDQNSSYWRARERIERENESYSPSSPWGAPGMNIHDFI